MAWYPGENPPIEIKDWNTEFKTTLKGELEEEVARKTLGKFLMYNIGFTVYQLTGFILEPYQRIIIKGWLQKNFTLCVAGRSFSKSFLCSHFCYLYCLFNPGHHIIVISATFRSSRRMLSFIEEWANRKRKVMPNGTVYAGGELLLQTFARKMEKKPDQWQIKFQNGSSITALPLGDSDNLRGFRCNVLVTDETLLIPQNTIDLVLKPFLAGGADITHKQRVRQKEDKRIESGSMKEEERRKFKSTSKMIMLSSASYKWEELYETYKKYRTIIEGGQADGTPTKREEMEDGVSSYLVQQMSYKVVKENLMDPAMMKEIKEKLIPESVIRREYGAEFIDESGGYFSAKEMHKCTIESGKLPTVEIVGEKGAQYVLGIDPSMTSSAGGDHFAMCVVKIVPRESDGRKVGLIVHQYACAGAELKHHIAYLDYILSRFNVVYIVCDTTQGDASDFINICNESEHMKKRKMELLPIAAEFTNEAFGETVQQVQKSYNPDSAVRRIVQKQYFSSPIIRAGNEYLRACFDQKLLYFPSRVQSVGDAISRMSGQDIMNIHNIHPEFIDTESGDTGNVYEFITWQDSLVDLVKKELALIEVKQNPLGGLTFDLPSHMTKNRKNEKRVRKDSYSALWLACWGLKIFLAAQDLPIPDQDDGQFTPRLI